MEVSIAEAAKIINSNGVIAYPTEAVFGLGCDPMSDEALEKILRIKSRDPKKGLIIIAANIEQVLPFIDVSKVNEKVWSEINNYWPGPFTFVMPCSNKVSTLLSGNRDTIAVRVSNHPTVKAICLEAKKAIVSTSCNKSGATPCKQAREVEEEFGSVLDGIVYDLVGDRKLPTEIRDAITGKVLRRGE